ncbi:hypothetical protein LBW56_10930 [Ralstonia solanacearum]|uniref:hypothetical protein n=1 Tax=Ralstonia solanacearum TaxID=305 RepID=UPI001FF8FE19|nr:hypothetical protein [Ralstonia solanacearum]MDB0527204.1 hypothetical protein [Ralstonia solanacearum]
MGEVKRRAEEIAVLKRAQNAWPAGLSSDERAIADTALRLHERLVVAKNFVGGCYHLAFFLRRFLHREHGVEVVPRVGYVNDGTGDIMTSHAWIEFQGKKTDISLTRTEYPEMQLPGELLVLDQVLCKGVASYTYHLEMTMEAEAQERSLVASGYLPLMMRVQIAQKRKEHADMVERSSDDTKIDAYLAVAPAGLNYESLVRMANT